MQSLDWTTGLSLKLKVQHYNNILVYVRSDQYAYIYHIKLKSHLSICTFWHTDNSPVSVRIEMDLARNESCVFEENCVTKFLFTNP